MTVPGRIAALRVLCTLAVLLGACSRGPGAAPAPANVHATYRVQQWVLPAAAGSGEPNLIPTSDGRLLLSWIDSVQGRRRALQFSTWDGNGRWQSAPRTIAVGNSLLADPANPPRLTTTSDGALWVSWLQGNPASGDALQLSRSADGGFNWSPPVAIVPASGSRELGFVSLWPQSPTSIGAAWIGGASAQPDATGNGPVSSLHAAVFDQNLRSGATVTVDAQVCDCCDTAATVTSRGALLVYRDRGTNDIRDIASARFDGTRWTPAQTVHGDGWHMPACPVNGPAVAAHGDNVLVGWFTAANSKPSAYLARSNNAGDRFDAPLLLDQGDAVLGRISVALDARQAWAMWMREDAGTQSLWLARYTPDLSRQLQRTRVATLAGRGRITGFPQLSLQSGNAYVVWTDIGAGTTQLRGAVIAP